MLPCELIDQLTDVSTLVKSSENKRAHLKIIMMSSLKYYEGKHKLPGLEFISFEQDITNFGSVGLRKRKNVV